MKEWVGEQEAALVCGGVGDAFFNTRRTPWQRGVPARHVGVETLNQIRDQRYPIPFLLAGDGAYAGSSPTVAGR
jgi:hypothetical protein